jgi:hypothetical protein
MLRSLLIDSFGFVSNFRRCFFLWDLRRWSRPPTSMLCRSKRDDRWCAFKCFTFISMNCIMHDLLFVEWCLFIYWCMLLMEWCMFIHLANVFFYMYDMRIYIRSWFCGRGPKFIWGQFAGHVRARQVDSPSAFLFVPK